MERNRLIAKAEIVFSMAVFGTISIFVRNIPLPSAELALCRAVIAAATLLVWQLLTRTMVRFQDIKKELPLLLLSGAAMGVNWILFFQAYKYTSVALATLSYYFAGRGTRLGCSSALERRCSTRPWCSATRESAM